MLGCWVNNSFYHESEAPMAARSAIPSYAAHAMLTLEATQRLPETHFFLGGNGMVVMAAMACGSKFNKLLDV